MLFDERRDRTQDKGCCVVCDRCTWFARAGQFYKLGDKMLCLEHYLKARVLYIGSPTPPESLDPIFDNLKKQWRASTKPDKKGKKSKNKANPIKSK